MSCNNLYYHSEALEKIQCGGLCKKYMPVGLQCTKPEYKNLCRYYEEKVFTVTREMCDSAPNCNVCGTKMTVVCGAEHGYTCDICNPGTPVSEVIKEEIVLPPVMSIPDETEPIIEEVKEVEDGKEGLQAQPGKKRRGRPAIRRRNQ
jgi:hypothetical protein